MVARALLIDADLRNPQLHNHLGAEIGPGLGDYLREEADEYSIVQRGPMENLFLIPAGRSRQIRRSCCLTVASRCFCIGLSRYLTGSSLIHPQRCRFQMLP